MAVGSVRDIARKTIAVMRARWYLRSVDELGRLPRLWGRAHVSNGGRMVIGERARLSGSRAPLELATGDDGILEIGARTFINFGTSIVATRRITIGSNCQIGPFCMVMDNSYHRIEPDRRNEMPPSRPVTIGDNVWLGARVIVLPGVSIGDHAAIGAGSVVTRDIPSRTLAAGMPARVIREI
jgi:acetyltransferase-like isoleucine patch superfamily enzyme